MKKVFFQGITAGVLAAVAGIMYYSIYQSAFETGFDKIINKGSIIGSSIVGTMLMACGYALLLKLKKETWTGLLNVLISVLSFASIIGPISMSLPLDIESPELFPGLVVPMHFFPALAFFTISPFFKTTT
jgi:branched-subunit amino acid ABC-type transport system permease component